MKNKGFTLIELLVVIAIIGILSTIGVVSFNSARKKARDAKREGDLRMLQSKLEVYAADNESYPVPSNWSDLMTALGIESEIQSPSASTPYCYYYKPSGSPTEYALSVKIETSKPSGSYTTDLSGYEGPVSSTGNDTDCSPSCSANDVYCLHGGL